MPKKQEKTNRRTLVKDLPKEQKELSREEQKRVKGGETLAVIPSRTKPGV